jgi:hypothetical protein
VTVGAKIRWPHTRVIGCPPSATRLYMFHVKRHANRPKLHAEGLGRTEQGYRASRTGGREFALMLPTCARTFHVEHLRIQQAFQWTFSGTAGAHPPYWEQPPGNNCRKYKVRLLSVTIIRAALTPLRLGTKAANPKVSSSAQLVPKRLVVPGAEVTRGVAVGPANSY